jgi:glucose/arabinose dehydrogenase
MVARRTLLLGSSGVVLGAVTGCSSGAPAPDPAAGSSSSLGAPSASPSASPAGRSTPPAVPSATPSTSASRPTVPHHPRPELAGTLLDDLEVPWGIAFLRSGDAVVGERGSGRLLRVSAAGRSRTLGTVPGVAAPTGLGEGGLLGLALAPGDEETLFAYLTSGSDNRVVRVSLAGGRVGRPRPVLTGIPTSTHHHGGRLLFDPDGMLLVSTGDAEESALAQSRSSLAGKILRIRPDGRAAPGNPFGNRTWSYGHRNIEGLAHDAAGRLWATEFGDKRTDELNLISKGRNYGWPAVEGRSDDPRYSSPRATWSPTSSCSPAGLAIAGSTAFVGALRGECLFAVPLDGTTAGKPRAYLAGDHGRIRSVALAPDNSLWVTTSNTDGRATPRRHDDRILRVELR